MKDMEKKQISHYWWWFDSHNTSKRSPWLHSALSELESKTKATLKLIEGDADSFAQRAEMYYKKRPELISMVGDLYRSHRALLVRYDQLIKSDHKNQQRSPFLTKLHHQPEKLVRVMEEYQSYKIQMENIDDMEDCAESEVNDPDEHNDERKVEEEEMEGERGVEEEEEVDGESDDEVDGEIMTRKLREEIGRLREEERNQKDQLLEKDEEKREVIRQLCVGMEVLRLENVQLRQCTYNRRKRKEKL